MTSTNFPQGRNSPVRQYIDNYAWVKGNHQIRFGGEYRQVVADHLPRITRCIPRTTLGTNASNPDNLSSSTLPGISAAELTIANDVFVNDHRLAGLHQPGVQSYFADFRLCGRRSGTITRPIQNSMAFYAQDSWKIMRNLTRAIRRSLGISRTLQRAQRPGAAAAEQSEHACSAPRPAPDRRSAICSSPVSIAGDMIPA